MLTHRLYVYMAHYLTRHRVWRRIRKRKLGLSRSHRRHRGISVLSALRNLLAPRFK